MPNDHPRFRNQLIYEGSERIDRLDPVVHEEYLSIAREFLFNRAANEGFGKWSHHGLNREAVFGRRLDHAHVAKADQRHVQRARDGRRGKRQDIDVVLQFFQAFLVRDAEALFLVHHQESEVMKFNIAR